MEPAPGLHADLDRAWNHGQRVRGRFFEALCRVREDLEATFGLRPDCYGASRDVYPSGMARDMGLGLKAYKSVIGRKMDANLVNIFETGTDVEPASVADQRAFAEACWKA